jgi:YVTN family beta-propeller protein
MTIALVRRQVLLVATALLVGALALAAFTIRASGPVGAAGSTGRASVYVSNTEGNTVSVIDPATQSVITTITVGDEPRNLAPNPSGSRVYVPNRSSNSVSVIDTANNTVVATVTDASFDEPYAVAVTPDGAKVYVANKQGGGSSTGSVTVLSGATNAVTGTVSDAGACLSSPEGIVADPVRSAVYVVNRNTNGSTNYQVCVVDTATDMVTTAVTVGNQPRYGVVTPNGAFLYTANNTSGDVTRIDLSDNSTTTIAVGGRPRNMALSNDGTKIYVATQNAQVAVIRVSDSTVTHIAFAGMSSSYGVAILPGSSYGYVTDENNERVHVFDTTTDTEITGTGLPIESTDFDTPRAITAVGDPVAPPPPIVVTPTFTG